MSKEQHALVKFLHARINDAESFARDHQHWIGTGTPLVTINGGGTALQRHLDPEHMLAECQAKRRIIHAFPASERWIETTTLRATEPSYTNGGWDIPVVLYILAQMDADHPDFQKEWLL